MDIKRFMKGLNEYEDNPDILAKASRLMDSGKYEEALSAYDEVLKVMPKAWMVYQLKATCYDELDRYDKAIECIDKAIKYSTEPFRGICVVMKVNLLSAAGRHAEAIKWSDKAIHMGMDMPAMHHIKGMALHQIYDETPEEKLAEKALRCYDKALKNDPINEMLGEFDQDTLDSTRKNILSNKGRLLFSLERYADAVKCFDEELLLDPDDAATLEDKSAALYRAGRYDEAIEYCKKVIKLESRDPEVLFSLAHTLYNLDSLQEALDVLNIALKLDPSDVDGEELRQEIIETLNLV